MPALGRAAVGAAGGFNAVQKLLTNRDHSDHSDPNDHSGLSQRSQRPQRVKAAG